ncbi:MAG: cytochrome c biogenesis protein CcdA [Dehalococcoidia bacterium]|nr:cytochrome c biogenesis protein CcdA [Dehalococcoidia bacterium]MDP6494236.1 cytochrome c biogenesis protein CcdA [Dehalococcoidia bacterium]
MSTPRSISASIRGVNLWRSILLPAVVACVSLSIAVIGAILLGRDSGIDGINRFVETLSGDSGSFLGDLGLLAPLGFAFAAGMASAVNPCGFAMLPAYLGLYLGTNEQTNGNVHPIKHISKGFQVGASVTAGFIVLFGIAGIIIGLGARAIVVNILPWLGLVIGAAMVITGSWMVGGGKLYTEFAPQAASRIGDPGQVSMKGYFLFGLSYGTASLSCTLPIFLSVIGTSFAVSNIAISVGQFLLYALGMGVVILSLTLGMAFLKGAIIGVLRRALPYIQPIGSWLMVVAGSYIVFYWLTIGGLR